MRPVTTTGRDKRHRRDPLSSSNEGVQLKAPQPDELTHCHRQSSPKHRSERDRPQRARSTAATTQTRTRAKERAIGTAVPTRVAGNKGVARQPRAETPRHGEQRTAQCETFQLPTDWLHVTSRGAAETIRTDTKTSTPRASALVDSDTKERIITTALKYRLCGTRQGLLRIAKAAISRMRQRYRGDIAETLRLQRRPEDIAAEVKTSRLR